MSGLLIRKGQADDCQLILQFIQHLADYEKLSHEVVATADDLQRTLFGEKTFANVLIAELDGKPVGFSLYFYNYSTFLAKPGLYLEDLFVLPEARGKGVGKALLAEMAKIALENDCGRFEWSVLDWNQPAIDFYRSIGAVGMDEWTVQRVDGKALTELAQQAI
ncbi:MAG: GNAT family N-acetyltransferase [Gammaproteobacteria bacterium]|nr:GNAT family N-acetyltransferase [Gammaproteobacteria bacterium]MDH5630882.1 GNAT family N-acetyltransferase [Gammaproteobacteria bacterium]